MFNGESFQSISDARAFNLRGYGSVDRARDEADELHVQFCGICYAVTMPLPGYVNDGHQCLTNGAVDKYLLPDAPD